MPTRQFEPSPVSASDDVVWPALANPQGTAILSLLYQLGQSQWQDARQIESLQLEQLNPLLEHAWAHVPWHRGRLSDAGWMPGIALTRAAFSALPIMTRADIQKNGEALYANALPKAHGRILVGRTSGSTGQPMQFLSTELNSLFWDAFTLRESLWHKRDFTQPLAVIRPGVKAESHAGWGRPFNAYHTGNFEQIPIDTPLSEQISWLIRNQPGYLLSTPNHLATLAEGFRSRGKILPSLQQLRTFGVTVEPRIRELCRSVFGVEIADMYSTTECGYLAFQCPESGHFHVQAESALVEVLREDGMACAPGETGRVVVTALHNFAMPLIRYDLGDFAEVGATCSCGRGLPVLNRIVGRVRNRARHPDGQLFWPSLASLTFFFDLPVRQWQIIQDRNDHLTVRLAVFRPLDTGEESRIAAELAQAFGWSFPVSFEYLNEFPLPANGKFEDFISLVTS